MTDEKLLYFNFLNYVNDKVRSIEWTNAKQRAQENDILMPNGHASSFEAWNSVTYCSGGYILCSLMRNKQNTLFSEEEALKVLY